MQTLDYQNIDLSSSCFSGLSEYFEETNLEKLGREVKFIERSTSRLSAWMFLQLNTCLIKNGKQTSLTDMVNDITQTFGIQLTKQSLAERFNIYGAKLMRKCYQSVFEQVLASPISALTSTCGFKRVILRDATSFQLPAYLSGFYEGNAGEGNPRDSTGSVIKLQHEYELLSGKILRLDFRNGKENDTEWLNEKGIPVLPNDLHLMDLGYYKLAHLAKIADEEGFFVSRYKVGTSLFVKDEKGKYINLDWEEMLGKVRGRDKGSGNSFEQIVYLAIGKKKLQVRLHLQKMPEEVTQKRLKKYKIKEDNQSNQKKQYQTSDFKKQLANYNVFLTNASVEQVKTEQIYSFYRLRWQIELLFKIWKSVFELDEIGKMSIGRFECYLYGKLIAILISGHIQSLFRAFMEEKAEFEMSEWKAYKLIKKS